MRRSLFTALLSLSPLASEADELFIKRDAPTGATKMTLIRNVREIRDVILYMRLKTLPGEKDAFLSPFASVFPGMTPVHSIDEHVHMLTSHPFDMSVIGAGAADESGRFVRTKKDAASQVDVSFALINLFESIPSNKLTIFFNITNADTVYDVDLVPPSSVPFAISEILPPDTSGIKVSWAASLSVPCIVSLSSSPIGHFARTCAAYAPGEANHEYCVSDTFRPLQQFFVIDACEECDHCERAPGSLREVEGGACRVGEEKGDCVCNERGEAFCNHADSVAVPCVYSIAVCDAVCTACAHPLSSPHPGNEETTWWIIVVLSLSVLMIATVAVACVVGGRRARVKDGQNFKIEPRKK